MSDRPSRPCDVCGQVDTDPRIVTAMHGPDQSGYVHFDCTDSLQHHEIIKAAGGNKAKLVRYLEAQVRKADESRG